MAETIEIRPQSGPQVDFLSTPADIAIYGGSAGSGKTWALLLEPLRHIHNPKFGCVAFRRTFPQITNEGGMWHKSLELYPHVGGRPKFGDLTWDFPSGARLKFAHLQYDTNVLDWQGSEVPLFLWDELTHFSRHQFFYMLSRNRSLSGVRPYVRGSCNPDPDSFVAELIAWWLDEETGYPIYERSGVLRWFYVVDDVVHWYATPDAAMAAQPLMAKIAPPKSLTFIPARISDNQALLSRDPGYMANLMALPLVERERLLGGNWKIRPSAGKVFNRAWFEVVPSAPAGGAECRFWDFAATEKKLAGDDPDYTAGIKLRKVGNTYYIVDCVAFRESPAVIETKLASYTANDAQQASHSGGRYMVRWEIEPGSAGKRESWRMTTNMAGVDARGIISTGDKLSRANALAAQAMVGNVKLVKGTWNEEFLTHMHNQPDFPHDDIMDATAGAFNALQVPAEQSRGAGFSVQRSL